MQGAELSEGLAGDGELTSLQPPPQTLPCLLLPPRCVSLCKQKWQWAKLLLKQLQKKNERTNGQLVLVLWLSWEGVQVLPG